jgi:hypothetical protein
VYPVTEVFQVTSARHFKLKRLGLMLALTCFGVFGICSAAVAQTAAQPLEIEVLPVLELPVTINKPVLVKAKLGYLLKGSLTNNSEFRQLGFRYSLAIVNAAATNKIISRSEGFTLLPYQTQEVTLKTPLQLKIKQGERMVLMLEQSISTDYVWEVIKAKDVLAAYLAGDYSITPHVLRVRNQIDAPPRLQSFF